MDMEKFYDNEWIMILDFILLGIYGIVAKK